LAIDDKLKLLRSDGMLAWMPKPLHDLTGKRFGRLLVLKRAEGKGNAKWLCRCDCGNHKTAYGCSLERERTQSCGCLQRELAAERHWKHGHRKPTSRAYSSWIHMKDRTQTSRDPQHIRDYQDRGIDVWQEWRESFPAFHRDMGDPPTEKHTLDRIDNERGYFPGNVRWATRKEQARNTRRHR